WVDLVEGVNTLSDGSMFVARGTRNGQLTYADFDYPPPRGRLRLDTQCVVTNACATVTSQTATITVCNADFNCDGVVGSQDFFDFLVAFFNVTPAADFNADGQINSQDFFDFLRAFFNGC